MNQKIIFFFHLSKKNYFKAFVRVYLLFGLMLLFLVILASVLCCWRCCLYASCRKNKSNKQEIQETQLENDTYESNINEIIKVKLNSKDDLPTYKQ